MGPAEDRHAAAARSRQHRLRSRGRATARSRVERGDDPPVPFSFLTGRDRSRRRSTATCSTRTIASAISCARTSIASPLFNGQIRGHRPALLPVARRQDRAVPGQGAASDLSRAGRLDVDEIYVNGFSMSLPRDVQAELVHALPGSRTRCCCGRVRGRVRLHSADGADATLETQASCGTVSRRADQRHVGLRGSGGAGTGRRHQRRACAFGARRRSSCGATRRTSAFWSTT